MKGHQPRKRRMQNIKASLHHPWDISVDATKEEGGRKKASHLHGCHVVGEHVRVTCTVGMLLPPSLMSQVYDEDRERQEYKGFGEGISSKYDYRSSEAQALERRMIGGGVGADQHVCLDDGLRWTKPKTQRF